jgi:hypothetical protein
MADDRAQPEENPEAEAELEERDGRLVIPHSGSPITDEAVSDLRDANQR